MVVSSEHSSSIWAKIATTHFVAGIVAALLADRSPQLTTVCFIALVFCQASLLGIWAGFASEPWGVRLTFSITGASYLALLLGLGLDELSKETFVLVVFAVFCSALMTSIVRLVRAGLTILDHQDVCVTEGLQFTIKQLMILTAIVAGMTAAGKALMPLLADVRELSGLLILALCYVVTALSAIWATLAGC
jgi:hypothetical protein